MDGTSWNVPFSFWTPPRLGEPDYGYFVRLVGEEYHKSARVYLAAVWDGGGSTFVSRASKVVHAIPLRREQRALLDRWSPDLDLKEVVVADQLLHSFQFNIGCRRFCAGCIAESAYHRVWWDLSSFQRCPFHRTTLVSRTASGRPYKWKWPYFETGPDGCPCGTETPRETNRDSFEYYLLSRLGAVPRLVPAPLLDDIPLHEVIEQCGYVGRLLGNRYDRKTPDIGQQDWQLGYSAMTGDRADLARHLEGWLLANTTQRIRNGGLERAFGWARLGTRSKWVRTIESIDWAMKSSLARNGRCGRNGLEGLDGIVHREMNLNDLVERYSMTHKNLKKILAVFGAKAGWPPQTPLENRSLFDADLVAKVDAYLREFVTTNEANDMLGGTSVARMLIRLGHLTGFRGDGTWMVHGGEVRQLVKLVDSLPVTGETKWVVTMRMYCNRTGLSYSEVVRRVLEGEISIAVRDPRQNAIMAWRFADPSRAAPLFERRSPGFVSRTEAEVITSLKSTTIKALIDGGILKGERGSTKIDAASLAEFHAKFVKATIFHAELGEEFAQGVSRRLRRSGVPSQFTDVCPGVDLIVARVDLEAVIGTTTRMVSSPAAEAVWERFKAFQAEGYSAFYLPPKIGRHPQKIYPANRKGHFEVHAEEDSVVIVKTFTPSKPREWGVYNPNRHLFRKALESFEWSTDGGSEIATFSMRNKADIKIARTAFDIVHWHTNKLTRERKRRPGQEPRGPGGIAFMD